VGGASADGGAPPVAGEGRSGGSAAAGGEVASGGSGGSAGAAGSGSPKGELYSDDFEDGDLTKPSWIDADPELGGMWTLADGDGGKVLTQAAAVSDWVIAVSGDYRWTDQVVEARVKITSEPGKAGIFARVRDTRNYYFLYLDGGSNIVLRKRVDNSSSDIQKVEIETTADTWYTLKLSVIGDTLEGYVDGKMLVSGSDTGVATGGVGMGTADCTAQFDDVTVSN
jgi:pectate lyase